jgi:enterochelin esterase-like enzyme
MTLTGLGFLALLVAVAAGLVAATMLLWNRWPRPLRLPLRLVSLVTLMAMAVVVAGDQVNRMYDFYETFSDLVGAQPAVAERVVEPPRAAVLPAAVQQQGRRAAARGHGIVVSWTLPGPRSKISRPGMVYLPAAYFDAHHPTTAFPVVEAFHGYTGSPQSWFHALGLATVLDTEIAAGRMPPVIAVVPKDYGTHDDECENVKHGDQDETYLAEDVPADVTASFRALTAPADWAGIGFSMGGFCAVNLALHHPERYGSAASLSGYFHATTDRFTGNLYRGDKALQAYNSPVTFAATHRQTVALYAFGTNRDAATRREVEALRRVYRTPGLLTAVLESAGSHTAATWQHAEAPALDWIGDHLGAPVAPASPEPGAVTLPPLTAPGPTSSPSSSAPPGVSALTKAHGHH